MLVCVCTAIATIKHNNDNKQFFGKKQNKCGGVALFSRDTLKKNEREKNPHKNRQKNKRIGKRTNDSFTINNTKNVVQ